MDSEEEALGELIPVALSRAHHYERLWGQPTGEFETAAMIGAWDAVKRYNPDLGATLRTYARHRIDGEIIDWHRKEMAQKGGFRGEKNRVYTYCVDFNDLDVSADGYWSEAAQIEKMLQGRTYDKGYSEIDNHDVLKHLHARMNEREWDIMIRCVCNEETMKSVGVVYGVSESRICQILPVALQHARKIIEGMNEAGEVYEPCKDTEDMLEAQWIRALKVAR
jgi:RNA polymerase sigma factor (sigma-70 family)